MSPILSLTVSVPIWWVGIKGEGKVALWMAELIEVHTHTGSVIEVGC